MGTPMVSAPYCVHSQKDGGEALRGAEKEVCPEPCGSAMMGRQWRLLVLLGCTGCSRLSGLLPALCLGIASHVSSVRYWSWGW